MLTYYLARFLKKAAPRAVAKSKIHQTSRIGGGSQFFNSKIDRYSYCGTGCTIINCDIGQFCSIADQVMIGGASHAIDFVSTSPLFNRGRNPFGKNYADYPSPPSQRTHVGHDVWIGAGAKIAAGVSLGIGAIVGMGAVVTKDVPSYGIVGGVPAKLLRYRFEKTIRDNLEKSHWWDMTDEQLSAAGQYFDVPEAFLRRTR